MRICPIIVSLPLFVSLALFAGTAMAQPNQLAYLVEEALEKNPELSSAQANWDVLRERALQAGNFDDPMVMFRVQNALVNDLVAFDQDPMTAKVIGISQQLPFAGKRALARQVATHAAEVGRWQYAERRLELTRMVKETYCRIYYVK